MKTYETSSGSLHWGTVGNWYILIRIFLSYHSKHSRLKSLNLIFADQLLNTLRPISVCKRYFQNTVSYQVTTIVTWWKFTWCLFLRVQEKIYPHGSRKYLDVDWATRHGSLTRYVKLWIGHAPRMPGTFSPPPTLAIPTCIKARAYRTCRDACRDR